eukprot:3645644-Prymnesium_polylepis.1
MVGRGASAREAAAWDGGCERRGRLRGREDERGGGREVRSTPTTWHSSRLRSMSPCAASCNSSSVANCAMRTRYF